jgi:hypothetical protein
MNGSTVVGKNASGAGGGGIDAAANQLTLADCIVAGNTASAGNDILGAFSDNGCNLLGTAWQGNTSGPGDRFSDQPLLAPLGYYGGPTQTMAPLPGSPTLGAGGAVTTLSASVSSFATTLVVADAAAIASTSGNVFIQVGGEQMLVTGVDLADNTLTVQRGVNGTVASAWGSGTGMSLATDQRGISRPEDGGDIGAFQSQGFTLSVLNGTSPQSAMVGSLFGDPLTVTVTANAAYEPVGGGVITLPIKSCPATMARTPP